MTNLQLQLLKPPSQGEQIPLPLKGPDKEQIIPITEVWITLNPMQQAHLFQQLGNICYSLIRTQHQEGGNNEPQ
jgi:hypothetical protein